jgi:nitric-oxide synthase
MLALIRGCLVQELGDRQIADDAIPAVAARPPADLPDRACGVDPGIAGPADQSLHDAFAFLDLLRREEIIDPATYLERRAEISASIARRGDYSMQFNELEHACRVAWRNTARCIGRLPWQTLFVRDCRDHETPEEIFQACVDHLRMATNDGRIRPVMTVFAAEQQTRRRPRIWNPQLIRYAGWRQRGGSILGDPLHVEFTELLESLGWRPREKTAFTVLPVVIQVGHERSRIFDLPADAVLEVPIRHPDLAWFEELDLRWHAVPMISDTALEAGGLRYPATPFNGWYMSTEIGARNLADVNRYNQLPEIARRLGLDTRSSTNLWRDRALVELNVAVLHSFRAAGVRMVDHHSASDQFMTHLDREEMAGRSVPGDWSWLVPPMSGSTTPVFHRYYAAELPGEPAFKAQAAPWRAAHQRVVGCPVQHSAA